MHLKNQRTDLIHTKHLRSAAAARFTHVFRNIAIGGQGATKTLADGSACSATPSTERRQEPNAGIRGKNAQAMPALGRTSLRRDWIVINRQTHADT